LRFIFDASKASWEVFVTVLLNASEGDVLPHWVQKRIVDDANCAGNIRNPLPRQYGQMQNHAMQFPRRSSWDSLSRMSRMSCCLFLSSDSCKCRNNERRSALIRSLRKDLFIRKYMKATTPSLSHSQRSSKSLSPTIPYKHFEMALPHTMFLWHLRDLQTCANHVVSLPAGHTSARNVQTANGVFGI